MHCLRLLVADMIVRICPNQFHEELIPLEPLVSPLGEMKWPVRMERVKERRACGRDSATGTA